jgi:hypothetical protein
VKRLEIVLAPGPIATAPAETLAVAIPQDERPLDGDAGWVDWRLGGALSRQLRSGFVSGEPGEAVLLPAQRPFKVARILLFGIGPVETPGRKLQRSFYLAAERLIALRTPLVLLALPRSVELGLDGEFLLRGCVQALSVERSDTTLSLVLPDAERIQPALESALTAVAIDAHKREVAVDVTWLDSGEEDGSLASGA